MQNFLRLEVWQRAQRLSLTIYRSVALFPDTERYGMVRQVLNAATSIESNIAEGSGRRTTGEFRQFLSFASGSLSELQCRLLIARDLGWLTEKELHPLVNEIIGIRRMLWSLEERLKS